MFFFISRKFCFNFYSLLNASYQTLIAIAIATAYQEVGQLVSSIADKRLASLTAIYPCFNFCDDTWPYIDSSSVLVTSHVYDTSSIAMFEKNLKVTRIK